MKLPPPGKSLGWVPGPVDDRDVPVSRVLGQRPELKQYGARLHYAPMPRLDQDGVGACVGFAHTTLLNAAPHTQRRSNQFGLRIYHEAQKTDEWEGEDYEGTSVRAGAKVLKAMGLYNGYVFTPSVDEMARFVLNEGPVVLGITWKEGMNEPDAKHNYLIRNEGEDEGGHAICCTGIGYYGNEDDWAELTNSWGWRWGKAGKCRILLSDLRAQFEDESSTVCCAPAEA